MPGRIGRDSVLRRVANAELAQPGARAAWPDAAAAVEKRPAAAGLHHRGPGRLPRVDCQRAVDAGDRFARGRQVLRDGAIGRLDHGAGTAFYAGLDHAGLEHGLQHLRQVQGPGGPLALAPARHRIAAGSRHTPQPGRRLALPGTLLALSAQDGTKPGRRPSNLQASLGAKDARRAGRAPGH